MARAVVPGSTPPRRVTRSQSRELDEQSGIASHKTAAIHDSGKAKAGSSRLSMVAEETPTSKYSTPMIPESPGNREGNSNISGTTFLPQDSSFEDGEADPIVMVDELSDLQSAATRLMDMFVTNAADPRNIVDAAKRLTNPRNTHSKRLKPAIHKLINAMKGFSKQAFIDVAEIKELIPSVQLEDTANVWSPSPILHKANCARLALDVLLATIGSQSPRHAIERLDNQFPAPFMDAIVKRSQSKPIGASTAEKQTFELALEIRTQYFIMELERRQNEKDFDPQAILRGVFYDELALEDADSKLEPGSLRGFNLEHTFEDENGRLPDRFQDDVIDRIGELEFDMLDEDGSAQIRNLKSASWTRFIQRTARFIYTRDKEIKFDLQQQPKLDEVEELLRKEIERREGATSETPESRQSVVSASVERFHESPARQARVSERELSIMASTERTKEPIGETNLRLSQPSQSEPSIIASPLRTRQSLGETNLRLSRESQREPSTIASPTRTREPIGETNPPLPRASQISVGLPSPASRPAIAPSKHSARRISSKTSRILDRSIDYIVNHKKTGRHEQDGSHLESQRISLLSSASERPSSNMPASRIPDEVPRSPPPRTSHPINPRAESIHRDEDDQDLNFNNDDESLNLDTLQTEAEVTASPVMRRTNLNGLFFDRPSQSQPQNPQPQSSQHQSTQYQNSRPRSGSDVWNTLTQSQAQPPQPAPPRSFIDRQANATRVSWGEGTEASTQSAQRRHEETTVPARTSTLKRRRIDGDSDDEDSDSDDPFDRDERNLDAGAARAQKRVRRDSSNQSSAEHQLQQSLTASNQAQPAASTQPASTQPSTQRDAPPPSRWTMNNTRAEPYNLNFKSRRWTEEETRRLITMVGKHGPSWAIIKQQDEQCPIEDGGPMFRNRTQVNLKDRARTIKRQFDREGMTYPPNFEKVTS